MTTSVVGKEIKRFLKDSAPAVLCIYGKWGVGKTYAWKHFLQEASEEIALKNYSYVSLFGQNSLADLKYSILESTVPAKQPNLDATLSSVSALYDAAKAQLRKNLHFVSISPTAQSYMAGAARALFLLVRKQIVCIDDLERAGEGLRVKDVLGLASYLKEERGCKVVLLLNEDAFEGEDRKDYEGLLEKVVDTRLAFSPTPIEAAELIANPSSSFRQALIDDCVALGITNIRVINKIQLVCQRMQELVSEFDPEVLRIAIHKVVLLGWMHYQPKEAPTFEFLEKVNSFAWSVVEDTLSKEEQTWKALLETYEFRNPDELDEVIIRGFAPATSTLTL